MNYIIFGAGKTAYTIKRYIENCKLDDQVIGFYDFYNNNPFNLNLVDKNQILNHEGKFIVGTLMHDSIISMKEMACNLFGIEKGNVLQINDVIVDGHVEESNVLDLRFNFDESFQLYYEVIIARASFNFDFFQKMHFLNNFRNEYLKYNLINRGDVIIDGGSFDGSTARIFSNLVEESGLVYSFDCDLENILPINKQSNIFYFEFALYDSETVLNFHKYQGIEAPGSFVSELNDFENDTLNVNAINLDLFNNRFMKDKKIDFIKLDIEGAEIKALLGAKGVIIRDKPKLAIACYHLLEHYWQIPELILSFNPDYKIGFDHYSDYFDGSVLYFY
jgi:FkbM family methyltransferase